MKKIFLLSTLVLFFIHTPAQAQNKYDELESCLKSLDSISVPAEYHKVVQRCYELGQPYKFASDLRGRALYFNSLVGVAGEQFNQGQDFSQYYESLRRYYVGGIKPLLVPARFPQLDDQTLNDVVGALLHLSIFNLSTMDDPSASVASFDVFQELQSRHLTTQDLAQLVYTSLVRTYEWPRAMQIQTEWPQIKSQTLPTLDNSRYASPQGMYYYSVSHDKARMRLAEFKFHSGPQIVMNGWCHFAFDAMELLSGRPAISQLMKQYGIVITSPAFDVEEIDQLRTRYPGFEMHPILRPEAWAASGTILWASPTFTFFLDGKVQAEFKGLNSVQQFCSGLKSIGLADGLADCQNQ